MNIRESHGVWAHECFTDIDLREFKRAGRPAQIAQGLKGSREIAEIVSALAGLPADRRNSLLNSCRRPLRPTWAELGEISPRGQTEAGQQAEKLIADAIVDMVKGMLERPPRLK